MRLFSVFIVSFCVLCISQSDAKAVNSTNDPKKIVDMPLELLLDIYEDLDVDSLANVAQTHPLNWNAATKVYKSKFAIEAFDIHGEHIFEDSFPAGTWPHIADRENKTKAFNAMLNSLQTFGHLITKLKLNYNEFKDEQREKVNQYLSNYLTDALVEIELDFFTESDLLRLAAKLKSVEHVRLLRGNISSAMNFSEIFTSVRTLDIAHVYRLPPSLFDFHFPNLTSWILDHMSETNLKLFEKRLRLNPQLTHVEMWNCEWKCVRLMSELLPNLTRLNVLRIRTDPPFEGDDIHLENLKVFTTSDYLPDLPRLPIVFGNLEEITCYAHNNRCFDIIMQNKNLRKICSMEFSAEHMQQIAEEIPNLEEIEIGHRVDDVNMVVRFIAACPNLRSATFYHSHDNNDAVVEQLQHSWSYSLIKSGYELVVFVRNETTV